MEKKSDFFDGNHNHHLQYFKAFFCQDGFLCYPYLDCYNGDQGS